MTIYEKIDDIIAELQTKADEIVALEHEKRRLEEHELSLRKLEGEIEQKEIRTLSLQRTLKTQQIDLLKANEVVKRNTDLNTATKEDLDRRAEQIKKDEDHITYTQSLLEEKRIKLEELEKQIGVKQEEVERAHILTEKDRTSNARQKKELDIREEGIHRERERLQGAAELLRV